MITGATGKRKIRITGGVQVAIGLFSDIVLARQLKLLQQLLHFQLPGVQQHLPLHLLVLFLPHLPLPAAAAAVSMIMGPKGDALSVDVGAGLQAHHLGHMQTYPQPRLNGAGAAEAAAVAAVVSSSKLSTFSLIVPNEANPAAGLVRHVAFNVA